MKRMRSYGTLTGHVTVDKTPVMIGYYRPFPYVFRGLLSSSPFPRNEDVEMDSNVTDGSRDWGDWKPRKPRPIR